MFSCREKNKQYLGSYTHKNSKKTNEGLKEDSIYEFLREKYGDWIVYDPQLNKNTYILWLLPLLLFLLGGAIMKKKLKFRN